MKSVDNFSVVLFGPFPEPTGGVSIHMSRLNSFLLKRCSVFCVDESPVKKQNIFNFRSFNFFKYFQIVLKADLFHVQSSIPIFRFFHTFVGRLLRKPVIITLHSYRKTNLFNSILNKMSIYLASEIIVVSKEIESFLKKSVSVIPAYISPQDFEFELPINISEIIESSKIKGKKIICSNASKLVDLNGRDLYGFDQIISAFLHEEIRNNWVAILNVSSLVGCEERYSHLEQVINERSLQNTIFLLNGPLSFSALIKRSDLFIRATLTDGDSISIREALSCKTPVLASDCVKRPIGVSVYSLSDDVSLKSKIISNDFKILNYDSSFQDEIWQIYTRLIKNNFKK